VSADRRPSVITPMTEADADDAAAAHIRFLSKRFDSKPGRSLLRLYYLSLIRSGGGAGFVARSEQQLSGFICGVWDPARIRHVLLSQYGPVGAGLGLAHLLLKPGGGTSLLRRLIGWTYGDPPGCPGQYELRPIVVVPEAQGSGVAHELVCVLVEDAIERGFDRIVAFTKASDERANRFYLKEGFAITESDPSAKHIRLERMSGRHA
jgi:ribosomal protein S18 acetylase RimI-like enzyme